MKELKSKYVYLIIIGTVIVLIIGILIGFNINKNNTSKHIDFYTNKDVTNSLDNYSDINNNDIKPTTDIESSSTKNVEDVSTQKNTSSEIITEEKQEYSIKDNKVINELENTLTTIQTSTVTEDFTKSAKKTFIDIVDFIFYGGEIKGVTFDELTDTGKQKVLELANKIDESIEKKVPNYKDKISDTATNAFQSASSLIKKGSNNLNEFMKSKLSEEDYNAIIDAKDDLVYYSKNAVSFIKDNAPKIYSTIKDKLSNWYQKFKNN